MTAGAVSAPLIIPMIHLQTHRAKNHIDTNTPVSIQSDTPDVLIFYTLDGSKPSFGPRESKGSRRYGGPILLPAGRVAVRAVAVTRDGRDSSTVTKVFSVELVESNEDQRQCEGTLISSGPLLKPSGGLLTGGLGSPTKPQPAGSSQPSQSAASRQQTDFLRCAQCQRPRPSDPFCGFRAQCGPSLPVLDEQRRRPAEGGQVLRCVLCNSLVPVNTHTCLICEAAVHQQQPQSSGARQPGHAASYVVCWRCGANGPPHAFYCATCGAFLEAPPPPTSCGDITQPVGAAATLQGSAPWRARRPSGPPPPPKVTTPSKDQSTQTVRFYYPSATELQRKETQRKLQLSKQHSARDQRPPLTSISPGRGFWRKQLDHLCAHLRSYAQNNAPFRTLLGEPRLGQMVSAAIQEDRYEVSLTFSFVSAGGRQRQVEQAADGLGPPAGTETLGATIEPSVDCQRGTWSEDKANDANDAHRPTLRPRPPVRDVQLLKELGPGPGRGRISIIQQLLDQGADPSCCDANGRHALAVAVVNGHHDVLPVLVQRGADVDQQSGEMKNTALHEAAALGSEGLKAAEVLLSCRASLRRRDVAGRAALDVALSSGCSEAAALLAARTGLDMLGRLGRPREDRDGF
uniref:double zinc ribbon and ankyrin repeat-containing protein 1 isoform X1 n=1 Tax=Gasterosteus aculeatus aculeatus TaxID=481459 RepID=UPI001A995CFA|nr:double zinc ribbon and ankyrin repeat-containing protein 1 isoform X1 [Gasterosteus aculeatus aculeatus]